MIKELRIEANPRQTGVRNPTRRLAREGQIAGILYGGGRPSITFQIDSRKLDPILHLEGALTTLFHFSVAGSKDSDVVLIKEIQADPVTGAPLHADLMRIDLTKPIQVKVPVHLVGTARGVKLQGGVLDFVHREIEIICLPGDIPDRIDADVTELDLGIALKVSDLKIPEGVKVLTDPNMPVATVLAPAAEKSQAAEGAEPAPEEAPAEPEVIAKGKVETEEKEGEGGKKEA